MSETKSIAVPKWPFFLGDAVLLGAAWFIYSQTPPPAGSWVLLACSVCVVLAAVLGVSPFVLDHRADLKRLDHTALGSVSEKLQNLEAVAAQISAATNAWQNVQLQSEKTSATAREITERIAAEARAFTEFLQKANDSERATLRLEVEKLRRTEADWLQVLVHTLDHVHALHTGAVRSGQPRLIEQIRQFQNACHDTARRVGLVPFGPAPGEAFDAQRHQLMDGEKAGAGDTVAETLAAGFTFQGRLVRPALVRLGPSPAAPAQADHSQVAERADSQSQLTLESNAP